LSSCVGHDALFESANIAVGVLSTDIPIR